MAYEIEVRGWAEWDDTGPIPGSGAYHNVGDDDSIRDIFDREDRDPGDVEGLWVRAYDPETGAEHYYWLWTYYGLEWDEWDDLIDGSMEMHGFSLA